MELPIKDPAVAVRPSLDLRKDGVALPDSLIKLTKTLDQKPKLSAKTQANQQKAVRLLKSGLKALKKRDLTSAATQMEQAVALDKNNVLGWRMLAFTYENLRDYSKAFTAYEVVAQLEPNDVSLLRDVGQLAYLLGKLDLSAKLLTSYLATDPDHEEANSTLASILRSQNRYGDAVDLLRNVLSRRPERPILWNTLGTVLSESGDVHGAAVFFDEALRLNPDFHAARHNRALFLTSIADPETAIAEMEIAARGMTLPKEASKIRLAKACLQLQTGDLVNGFETYEARFDGGDDAAYAFTNFGKRWEIEDDLRGKSLLVYGEQGLGDEVLFANVLNDTLDAVGLEGQVYLAVEPRLVSLFQRSFPRAVVLAYQGWRQFDVLYRTVDLGEAKSKIDLWTPMGSLFRRFRTTVEAFPKAPSFLVADPERVIYWRQHLEASGPGPYVGVLWKSINMNGGRQKYYSPFDQWGPVLKNTKARFVNLQYGDAADDLAEAKARGFNIWTPPSIDLKMDIDDLAALCAAMDVVIGPSTATTNIAAAVGTEVWISAGPGWWPCFGTDYGPCYPSLRLFRTNSYDRWAELMEEIGAALEQRVEMAHSGALQAG